METSFNDTHVAEKTQSPWENIQPEDLILVVCFHGQSRSQIINRVLRSLGYSHTIIMDSRNQTYELPDQTIRSAKAVVCAADDVLAELAHHFPFLTPCAQSLKLTEQEHAATHLHSSLPGQNLELETKIKNSLIELGLHQQLQAPQINPNLN